ncbi:hypothetical protein VTN02DRAFT_5101 [Thermoascus thermophilus]
MRRGLCACYTHRHYQQADRKHEKWKRSYEHQWISKWSRSKVIGGKKKGQQALPITLKKKKRQQDIFVIDGIHKKKKKKKKKKNGGMYLDSMMVSPCFFTMRQVCFNSDKNKSAIGSVGRRKKPLRKSNSPIIRLRKHRKKKTKSNSQVHTSMV